MEKKDLEIKEEKVTIIKNPNWEKDIPLQTEIEVSIDLDILQWLGKDYEKKINNILRKVKNMEERER